MIIPDDLALRFLKAFGGMGKWRGVMQEMLDEIERQLNAKTQQG
jgi:hypothetical protein